MGQGCKVSRYSGVSLDSPILIFYSSLGFGLTGSPCVWKPSCQLLDARAAAAFLHWHSWVFHAVQEPLASFPLRLYYFTLDMPCYYNYAVHPFSSKTQFRFNFYRGFSYLVFFCASINKVFALLRMRWLIFSPFPYFALTSQAKLWNNGWELNKLAVIWILRQHKRTGKEGDLEPLLQHVGKDWRIVAFFVLNMGVFLLRIPSGEDTKMVTLETKEYSLVLLSNVACPTTYFLI